MAVRITMALAATIAVTVAASTPVKAAPYEGRYVIYFGGLTIGAMQAKLYVTDNEYNLKLDIRAKGVSELVTNFAATTELGGIIEQGKLVSHGYELRWQDDGEEKYARLIRLPPPSLSRPIVRSAIAMTFPTQLILIRLARILSIRSRLCSAYHRTVPLALYATANKNYSMDRASPKSRPALLPHRAISKMRKMKRRKARRSNKVAG